MATEAEVIQLGVGFDAAQANAALDQFARTTQQRLEALRKQFSNLTGQAPSVSDVPTAPTVPNVPAPVVPDVPAPTGVDRWTKSVDALGQSAQKAGTALTIGVTAPLLLIGDAARKSSAAIDANVNTLKAFLGGTAQAEARYKQLINIANQTPGLTGSLAAVIEAQGRIAEASTASIDKLLPAVGRLNAISPIGDPKQFVGNLVQLISQNFERADLKELVGNSPFAGELIKQVFNVDSPTNSKAIREAAQKFGIDTVDELFAAFGKAAEDNPQLQAVTESIATRLEKAQDRFAQALRPLGDTLNQNLLNALQSLTPFIERIVARFNDLSPAGQQAVVTLGLIAAAVGPVLVVLGTLATSISAIGGLFAVGGVLAGGSAVVTGLGAGIAALGGPLTLLAAALVGAGLAWYTFSENAKEATDAALANAKVGVATLKFLDDLSEKSKIEIADKQQIADLYRKLTPEQQARVKVIADETVATTELERTVTGLKVVYGKLNDELRQQAFAKAKAEVDALSQEFIASARQAETYKKQLEETRQGLENLAKGAASGVPDLRNEEIAMLGGELAAIRLTDASLLAGNEQQRLAQKVQDLTPRFDNVAESLRKTGERILQLSHGQGAALKQFLENAKLAGQVQAAIEAIGFVEIDPLTGKPVNPNSPLVQPFEVPRKTVPAGGGAAAKGKSGEPTEEELRDQAVLKGFDTARKILERQFDDKRFLVEREREAGLTSEAEYQDKLSELEYQGQQRRIELVRTQQAALKKLHSLDRAERGEELNKLNDELLDAQRQVERISISGLINSEKALGEAHVRLLETQQQIARISDQLRLARAEEAAATDEITQGTLAETRIQTTLADFERQIKLIDEKLAKLKLSPEERRALTLEKEGAQADLLEFQTSGVPQQRRRAARSDDQTQHAKNEAFATDQVNRTTVPVETRNARIETLKLELALTGEYEIKERLRLRQQIAEQEKLAAAERLAQRFAEIDSETLRNRQALDERLIDVKRVYGEDSAEYQKLLNDKQLLDQQYREQRGQAEATAKQSEREADAQLNPFGQIAAKLEEAQPFINSLSNALAVLGGGTDATAKKLAGLGGVAVDVFKKLAEASASGTKTTVKGYAEIAQAGLASAAAVLGSYRLTRAAQALDFVIKGSGEVAESAAAFARQDYFGGVLHAAAAGLFFVAAGKAGYQAITGSGNPAAAAGAANNQAQAQTATQAQNKEPQKIVIEQTPVVVRMDVRTDGGQIVRVLNDAVATNNFFRNLVAGVSVDNAYAT